MGIQKKYMIFDEMEGHLCSTNILGTCYYECEFTKKLDTLKLDLIEFRAICMDKIDNHKRERGRNIYAQAKGLRDISKKAIKELFSDPPETKITAKHSSEAKEQSYSVIAPPWTIDIA